MLPKSYLPPEILSCILGNLPRQTLLPLRVVSKTVLHLINSRIFCNITLPGLVAGSYGKNPYKLIELLSTSSPIVSSLFNIIRKITLETWPYGYLLDHTSSSAFLPNHLVPLLTRLSSLDTVMYVESPLFPHSSPFISFLQYGVVVITDK